MKSPELTIKEAENKITSKEKILAGLIDKREERLAFLEKAKGAKKEWRENVAEKKQLETAMAPYNKKIAKLESEITELKTKIREHKDNVPEQEVLEPTAGAEYVIETLDLENLIKKNDQVYQIANIEVKKIAAIPSRKRSPEQKQTKNRLEREMAALKERIEEMKALKSEIELSSQEIVDRKKKQNLLKWFVVNDFSAETKKFVELKSWEYDDGDFLNEQVPFGQFDPISDENNNLESVYINGIQIQLINRAQVTKGKLVEIADDKARFNVLGPDGKIIPGGANLTLSKADELAEAKSKERQKATVANFTSIPDTDAWNEGEIKKLTEAVNEKIRTFKKENGIALDPAIIPPVVQTVAPIVDDVLEGLLAELEQTEEELEIIQTEANPIQDALTRISNKIDELVATYKFKDSDLEDKPVVPPAPKAEIPKGEPLFDLREKKKNEPKKDDDEALKDNTKTTDDTDPTKKKADKKKDKAPEPKLENYKKFVAAFRAEHKDDYLNVIIDKLELNPEFTDPNLSEGKRMLVVQAMMDSLYERVETEAAARIASEMGPAAWAKDIWGVRKITQIGKSIWTGSRKGYLSREYKEDILLKILNEGDNAKNFVDSNASHYIKLYTENKLDGILQSDGKTVYIDYAKTVENNDTSPEAITFNRIATEFSRLPQSWSRKEEATPDQFKRWQEKKLEFDRAVVAMGPTFKKRALVVEASLNPEDQMGAEARGALNASTTKRLIEFMSRLAKNPEATAELHSLVKQSEWTKVKESLLNIKNTYWKQNRIASIAAGAIARYAGGTVLAGTAIGGTVVFGLPLAAVMAAALAGGAVGGIFRAKGIAQQKLIEQTKQTRLQNLSQNKKIEQVAVMSRIDHRLTQIKEMTQVLESLNKNADASAIEIANTKNRLQTHLAYVQDKIAKSEMIFGNKDEQYTWDLGLMLAAQEADVAIAMTNRLATSRPEDWINEFNSVEASKLGSRRESMLRAIQNSTKEGEVIGKKKGGQIGGTSIRMQVGSDRSRALRRQRIESATIGAFLGSAGAYISHYIHTIGHTPEGVDGDTVTVHHNPASHPDGTHPGVGKPELTQDDIQKSLSHVTIKKGEGIGSALLRFRHTDSFRLLEQNNPKLAGFFKGNIWEEAQKLHAFRPGNAGGDSLLVGEGSELGISPDGDIYLINTLKPGHPQLLGHINPQTGEFTDVPPNSEFHYRSPRHHSPSDNNQSHPARPHNTEGPDGTSHTNRPHNVEGPDAVEGDHANPPHNTEGPDEIPNANRPRNTEGGPDEIRNAERGQNGNEMPNGNRINRPHNVEGPDNEQNPGRPRNTEGPIERNNSVPRIKNTDNFSRDDWNRVHNISHRDLHDDLNQYFGKRNLWGEITNSGERSLPYQSLVNRDASSIMRHFKQHSGEFKPEVQKFLKHTQALAQAHPHISPSGKFGQYVENLYKADATEFVAKNPNIDPK